MPRQPYALVGLAVAALVVTAGCSSLGTMFGSPAADSGGCSPQVAAGYRTQTEIPVGTLQVRVVDAGGVGKANVGVSATRLVYTGLRCPSVISGTTDASGVVRFERMKTGPYEVRLSDDSATASAQVDADTTASVTLQVP